MRLPKILITVALLPLFFNQANPDPGLRIVIHKARRELQVYSGQSLLKSFVIGLGTNPVGPKERAGDRRTPEGDYYVCVKNPHSAYYLSLGISYPNARDAQAALQRGSISRTTYDSILRAGRRRGIPPWNTNLGGEIFIHGRGAGSDWTWGCVALEDSDMLDLYNSVTVGTPVTILP